MTDILPTTQKRKNRDPEWAAPTTQDEDDPRPQTDFTIVKDDFSIKAFKNDVSNGYEAIKSFVGSLWPTK